MTSPIDPSALADRLLSAGIPRDQADAHLDVLTELMRAAPRPDLNGVAKDEDIRTIAQDLRALAAEIDGLRGDLAESRERLDTVRSGVRSDLDGLRHDMDTRLEGLLRSLSRPKMGWGAKATFWMLGLLAALGALAASFVSGALAPDSLATFIERMAGR